VDQARPGDLVIICGKGHEQSMCFGMIETPWSEHEAVRAALRRRLGSRQNQAASPTGTPVPE
jgi:UDP-N-acetylmuramoyl-L-alanyl-D-glutamate--2,6-diaminopimelate ligase